LIILLEYRSLFCEFGAVVPARIAMQSVAGGAQSDMN